MCSNMKSLKERLIDKCSSQREYQGLVRSPSWFEPIHSTDTTAHTETSGHPYATAAHAAVKGGSTGPGSEAGRYAVPLPGRAIAYRAKKSRIMRWLVLHSNSHKETLQLDKRALIQFFHLDVPTRDMRLMDATHGAAGSNPAANNQLLVRDNALLICMEHVRCIITADLVIVPLDDERSEASERFNSYLEHVIHERLSEGPLFGRTSLGPTQGGSGAAPLSGLTAALQAVAPGLNAQGGQAAAAAAECKGSSQQGPGTAGQHPELHHGSSSSVGQHMPTPTAGGSGNGSSRQQPHGGPPGAHSPLLHAHTHAHAHSPTPPGGSSPTAHGGHVGVGMEPWDVEMPMTPDRTGPPSQRGSEELPFELHMLEAALGEVTTQLGREVEGLQAMAGPALEDLVNSSDKANLERVRRIKTSHQRLFGRVRAVRESLHRLMEDDADMWRMCLSKTVARKATAVALNLTPGRAGSLSHLNSLDNKAAGTQAQAIPNVHASSAISDSDILGASASLRPPGMLALKLHKLQHRQLSSAVPDAIVGTPGGDMMVAATSALDEDDLHDVLDVEALLEAYYLAADNTLAQLMNIGEYIDDTEDLVNIQLDYARNKLIRFEVVLTTGTFALAFMSCVAGILGENLVLPSAITGSLLGFITTNVGIGLVCITIFFTILNTLKARKLL